MASYVITGTSKGLGLELTKQLLDSSDSQVGRIFAITRSEPTPALKDLIKSSNGRVVHILASVDDTSSVEQAAREIGAHLGSKGLDVLVNNAAIQEHIDFRNTDGKVENFTAETMLKLLDTNTVGPHRVTKAFLPLLKAGTQKKVINVTSTMGSIAWADAFHIAPGQAYKVSKAALHMLNKQYALDHAEEGFTFLLVSPGHLKTDLGGPGDFTVDVGAAELKRIILKTDKAENGKFLNIHVAGHENDPGKYDGKEVPW